MIPVTQMQAVPSGQEARKASFPKAKNSLLLLLILLLPTPHHGDSVNYSYSLDDGKTFQPLGPTVPIIFSWWKGSRPALFAYTTEDALANAYVDVDWARYKRIDATIP
jgi:hypothetical protein